MSHGEECRGAYGVICLSCNERVPDLWQAFEDMQAERDRLRRCIQMVLDESADQWDSVQEPERMKPDRNTVAFLKACLVGTDKGR